MFMVYFWWNVMFIPLSTYFHFVQNRFAVGDDVTSFLHVFAVLVSHFLVVHHIYLSSCYQWGRIARELEKPYSAYAIRNSIHNHIYIYLSIYPSIHPSIHPSIYLSIFLSLDIYIYLPWCSHHFPMCQVSASMSPQEHLPKSILRTLPKDLLLEAKATAGETSAGANKKGSQCVASHVFFTGFHAILNGGLMGFTRPGKLRVCYGKSPCFMGSYTISLAISNSFFYVKTRPGVVVKPVGMIWFLQVTVTTSGFMRMMAISARRFFLPPIKSHKRSTVEDDVLYVLLL